MSFGQVEIFARDGNETIPIILFIVLGVDPDTRSDAVPLTDIDRRKIPLKAVPIKEVNPRPKHLFTLQSYLKTSSWTGQGVAGPVNDFGSQDPCSRSFGKIESDRAPLTHYRVNFLYFTRFGSMESGPRRWTLSAS